MEYRRPKRMPWRRQVWHSGIGEKPSPWCRSGSRCDDWGAGRRSCRQGQAGPVREDLQSVWCRVLLHPGHRYVLENWWLGSLRGWLSRRQQLDHAVDGPRVPEHPIRSYIAVGMNFDSPAGGTFNGNRAFIQFAGFTFGLTQSFYDFFSTPATSYWAAYPASDWGDPGWKVAAY